MATQNKPNKISCDAFSDSTLVNSPNNGIYSNFTNELSAPLLNVKSIRLDRINFINNSLQLNDYNGQLIFVYSANDSPTIPSGSSASFRIIRLYPSNYVPATDYNTYVKNKYFNNGAELVAALNQAASTGGDDSVYNPTWVPDDIVFTFDSASRKISIAGKTADVFYAPVPSDHPMMNTFFSSGNRPTLYTDNGIFNQLRRNNITMNKRLGFAMSYNNRGVYWNSANSQIGCATSTGVPVTFTAPATITPSIEADSWPILLSTQNINVYCTVISGTGQDSRRRRNLLGTIPVENVPLGVCSYTISSDVKVDSSNEINSLQFLFLDDDGNDYFFMPNFQTNIELGIFYD